VAAAPPPARPELVEPEPEPEAAAPAAAEPAARPARRAAPARVARRAPPAEPRPVDVSVEAAPGASILVDGRPVGTGTVEGLQLPAGPHRVEVWLPDGRVVERVVDVRGTRYEVKVR
jgi:hypothetical protein